MKLTIRLTIAAFVIAFAMSSQAQSPNVAIRIGPPPAPGGCFPVIVKNLRTTPINTTAAYIHIFDQSNCKQTCVFKIPLPKTLGPCQSFTFTICCNKPLPSKWITYVRVNHNFGNNEQWLYRP